MSGPEIKNATVCLMRRAGARSGDLPGDDSTDNSAMTHPDSVVASPARLATLWWPLALLAVVAPTLIAAHDPPSVTFYNQVLAVAGWGLFIAALSLAARDDAPPSGMTKSSGASGLKALSAVLLINATLALGSGLFGRLAGGLSLMGGGMSLAAFLALQAGWRAGQGPARELAAEVFFGALALAGVIGMALGWVQVFQPGLADGLFIAEPTMVGRAVGNLRQPNHFSTLLVWSCCGMAWLGSRRRVPTWLASLAITLFIGGVVWTASRTGMIAMAFLTLWGVFDKRLPRLLRMTLIAAVALYAAWWGGMYLLAHADKNVAFAAGNRLHDGSDISSSRFKIWANVIALIRQHPWAGVGYGEFNLAWTLTPFPDRPVAFFDHTHNIVLQWAVEFGLPLAALLLGLVGWGLAALLRRGLASGPTVGASAVIVALAGLHSLLEYPLWYSYFLLPAAFAWGLGLAASTTQASTSTGPQTQLTSDWAGRAKPLFAAGTIMFAMAAWCAIDYQSAANIYAPRAGAGPLDKRIAFGQQMPWFGYQADYAYVTGPDEEDESRPPEAFRRTLHNLLDARLMIAYSRSLAEHGEPDKASFVVDRLKEFKNNMSKPFLAVCQEAPEPGEDKPFQCTPPKQSYTWRELLPN
jgi:O-antigen ligase